MAGRAVGVLEAMPANGSQQRVLRRKGDHALSDVSHCRHVEGFAKRARGAAAVGHRDNGRDVERLTLFAQFLQAAQEYGKACTSAYPYDLHRPSPLTTTPMVLIRIKISRRSEMFFA